MGWDSAKQPNPELRNWQKNRGELPRQLSNIPCHGLCIRTFVGPFYVCPMLPVIPLGPEWLDEY